MDSSCVREETKITGGMVIPRGGYLTFVPVHFNNLEELNIVPGRISDTTKIVS